MSDCATIDPLITLYIDGEIAAADRDLLEQHLRACLACRTRVSRERAVRDLVGARRQALHAGCASLSLHARCAAAGRDAGRVQAPRPAAATWRSRVAPLAIAATLVLVVGAAFLYPLTARSSRV